MKQKLFIVLFFLILSISIIAADFTGIFDAQEMFFYDWLMKSRPAQITNSKVAIIEISDDTLKSLGRWPLPRDYHALLINALDKSGCCKIVFDIMLSEIERNDPVLAKIMFDSGKVYLSLAFRLSGNVSKQAKPFVASEILASVSESFKDSAAGIGHINIFVDSDGKARRLPLLVRHGERFYPSLGLLAAVSQLGYPLKKLKQESGKVIIDDKLIIPVDKNGAFWVNYPGAWTETFAHFSYIDVLKAYAAEKKGMESWLDLSVFKDKICFVGLTAAGTSDFRANPFDTVYPMVGAQASVCDSILRGAFIRRLFPSPRALINILIIFLALDICLMTAPLWGFLWCILLAIVHTTVLWLIFAFKGVFFDLFLPLAGIALVYAVVLLRKFFEEAQKRIILEKELEIAAAIQRSFLPPEIKDLGSVQIRAFLKPAKFVGGDFYDIIILDESTFGIFIGDVSGKGVPAALIMAQAISLFRVIAREYRNPADVLNALNKQLSRILQGRFVTGQYIVIYDKEGVWEGASAGHMPVLFFNKSNLRLAELLHASGPPLGLAENVSYSANKFQFKKGERIFMYTDGWTESRNRKQEEFGIARLKEIILEENATLTDEFLGHLQLKQKFFEKGAEQHDDLTAVFIEF